jgi:hypothetical protein
MDELTAETTLCSAVPPIGPSDTSQSVVSVMLGYLDSGVLLAGNHKAYYYGKRPRPPSLKANRLKAKTLHHGGRRSAIFKGLRFSESEITRLK